MQFITNGPDIPNALLQAHEDGRVVFFCGAGISYPAGLPGFQGLVEKIYRHNGTSPDDIERTALNREQYDAALDLLERRLPGQRVAVRTALAQALKPKLERKGATATHAALLRLARDRNGSLRLVTTNFDRIFHVAARRSGQMFVAHAAPMLPIPKNSRWNGLVYLHGLLPEKRDSTALNRLVVTSGDFGLAYLTERWAARFVSELFRNYVVCFVGYSINDPVLRYMMDALAADRMLGEATPQAWALGDVKPGRETETTAEWEAKGVVPILYPVATGSHDHSALHETLRAWSETYRDGVTGKERIVVAHALARPSASTQQDDFVGRMLWAISDRSGLPAKQFAEFSPAPPLDWLLDAFALDRFGPTDLPRFGVASLGDSDEKLRFSLVHRPAPYRLAPPMRLVSSGGGQSNWDEVMPRLAQWLARHLNDPRLIVWIAERGGQLHDLWLWQIERKLDELASMQREGKTAELESIRVQAPNAVPGTAMWTLWRLLLSGRVKSHSREFDLFRWKDRLRREGLTASTRLELRELLSPKVRLSKRIRWTDGPEVLNEGRVRDFVDFELVLAADHVRSTLLKDASPSRSELPLAALLDDLEQLLRDGLDVLRELGEADERSDRSHWDLPSITPHWQNRGFRDWVSLIELLRDAWLTVRNSDSDRATRIAQRWFGFPYSTFKRLALFAASQDASLASEVWIEWLLTERRWWLWSIDTRREVMRLLVLQGARLSSTAQRRLEWAILEGPPRSMYRAEMESAQWIELSAHSIWLRLAKLQSSGASLGNVAAARLAELSTRNSSWRLAANEQDEFSHWMSGTGDPDYEQSRQIEIAPRTRRKLIAWLGEQAHAPRQRLDGDTWGEVCKTRFFPCLYALSDLGRRDIWPTDRWRQALQVWSEDLMVPRTWRYVARLVKRMPNEVLHELRYQVSWWLDAGSKSNAADEHCVVELSELILELPEHGASTEAKRNDHPVSDAINHPIGHVIQALINVWFRRQPKDDQGLPADIEPMFSKVCDVRVQRYRHGRVLLASRLIALFRVDRAWTERTLLPLFNWGSNPAEAKAVWEGFLWSPRLYSPLLVAFKSDFLGAAEHYADLGEHARQMAAFLTYAALGPIDGYADSDWQAAFESLPAEGLQEASQALAQALEGAAEQREEYWRHRVRPFWKAVWPKSRKRATPQIGNSLARLAIAAGDEFPEAVSLLSGWLSPIEHPDYVVRRLHESRLSEKYPRAALHLLSLVVNEQPWAPRELRQCLDAIARAHRALTKDPRYERLSEYARRKGL